MGCIQCAKPWPYSVVVANLFMYSLSGIYHSTLLDHIFLYKRCFRMEYVYMHILLAYDVAVAWNTSRSSSGYSSKAGRSRFPCIIIQIEGT